jgi:hypothetical protein
MGRILIVKRLPVETLANVILKTSWLLHFAHINKGPDAPTIRRKPQLDYRYNLLICIIYVFINARVKIDTISNLCASSFGEQLTHSC